MNNPYYLVHILKRATSFIIRLLCSF